MDSTSNKIRKRRDEVYRFSPACFFKNLANNTLKKSNFTIFTKNKQINPELYFSVEDTLSFKKISILPGTDIEQFFFGGSQDWVYGLFRVLYKKKLESSIYFFTNNILVDTYGNHDALRYVIYSGTFGVTRVGLLLPLNYELHDN